jgi:hypothetical protein
MTHVLQNKVGEYRRNADACENWATTVSYPDIRQAFLDLAKQWREMADRFERLQLSVWLDDC